MTAAIRALSVPVQGETWPLTRAGWAALITAMRARVGLVFGPMVAHYLDDYLRVALLHATVDMPAGGWSPDDVRGFSGLYGQMIRDIRDQPVRGAGPLDAAAAAELIDLAVTDLVLTRQRDTAAGERVNLVGVGAHVLAYLAEHDAALYSTGGPQ